MASTPTNTNDKDDDHSMADDSDTLKSTISDSDSDIDDASHARNPAQLQQLQSAVAANPFSYEAHVQVQQDAESSLVGGLTACWLQYIDALQKAAELENLRLAREAMNTNFPLTPRMWLDWCQDESRLADSAEAIAAVEALYKRGVQEYLSIPVWLQYLEFVEEQDTEVAQCTGNGIAKMRALFEQALSSTGLHYIEGGKVWEAYRDYESALLLSMAEASAEIRTKQVEVVRNLFHRQLTVPLADHAQTLEEYKKWEQEQLQGVEVGDENNEVASLPPRISYAYQKAEQMCRVRESLESNISAEKPLDGNLLHHYLTYISTEEATGEPCRVQILYERAVSVFPVTHEIWLKYTQYLDINLKVAPVIRNVYERAVRNCPWVGSLWTKYLLALERTSAPETEHAAVFERALLGGFQTPNEYEDVYFARAHCLRRQIMAGDVDSDQTSNFTFLHDTFTRATEFMSTYFPDFVDHNLRMLSYWARLEAKVLKNVVAARGVWENLISSHGRMLEVWQNYIAMEILLGNVKEARALYKRCFNRRLDGMGTEVICAAWLRFEEEYGTLEDYDRAVLKVGPRVAEVQNIQNQQEQKVTANKLFTRETTKNETAQLRASESKSDSSVGLLKMVSGMPPPSSKRKDIGYTESENASKRQKEGTGDGMEGGQAGTSVSEMVRNQSTGDAEKEEQSVVAPTAEGPKQSEYAKKPVVFKDDCTAFLSNLALNVTEEDIRELFNFNSPNSGGGVKEVRLLRERGSSKLRGLAYVDFEDEESLAAAVAKNNQKLYLRGREVSIARSNPTGGRARGRGFGAGSGYGHHGGRGSSGGRGGRGPPMISHRRGGHVKLTGANTFAVPRTVARPLGWGNPQETILSNPGGEEAPKSNSEFRNIFLKRSH